MTKFKPPILKAIGGFFMDIHQILDQYDSFEEVKIKDRFLKHQDLEQILQLHSLNYSISAVGASVEGRSINLIKTGAGQSKIFLWSQMHGNEATGTMALLDLLNFFQKYASSTLVKNILENCTIFIAPMINPDGAERFTRRNVQQIDINRDFLATTSPEALLLKSLRDKLEPDFGFNLHDQSTLWSVKGSKAPATLSYLAPAVDEDLSIPEAREQAMQVIADIFQTTKQLLPENIGLFTDEYEPRAFGDNFQKLGTSTILIEAGGLEGDLEKQKIRKYYFLSILTGLQAIASKSYIKYSIEDYFKIPTNGKHLYHIILKNVIVNGVQTSICLNYEEVGPQANHLWRVHDIGDCTGYKAYSYFDQGSYQISEYVEVDFLADFQLKQDNQIKLTFKKGILVD